jgi:hypothetical protein
VTETIHLPEFLAAKPLRRILVHEDKGLRMAGGAWYWTDRIVLDDGVELCIRWPKREADLARDILAERFQNFKSACILNNIDWRDYLTRRRMENLI